MAQLFTNPSDENFSSTFGQATFYSVELCSMAAFFFVASILQLCYYHWIVYPPIFICYWFKRFKLYCRHQFLSWEWWLVMISTIMLQPMRCPVTQRLFGTAWDAPKERLFRIQRELKQLTRDRRRLDSDSSYFYEYSDLFSAIHDLTLAILAHCIAFAYFVAFFASEGE